jgi:hypothetical protein
MLGVYNTKIETQFNQFQIISVLKKMLGVYISKIETQLNQLQIISVLKKAKSFMF